MPIYITSVTPHLDFFGILLFFLTSFILVFCCLTECLMMLPELGSETYTNKQKISENVVCSILVI